MIPIEQQKHIAKIIGSADGLIIAAGAGMGVDSGLPDFRGRDGFWKSYPALEKSVISFEDIANPNSFNEIPSIAWGFYGHRLNLYRRTVPHAGFGILVNIGKQLQHGYFVYTSNVDGQFQKSGVNPGNIFECHGSIHLLQCINGCSENIWSANKFNPEVDESACILLNEIPMCLFCNNIARPNILMFNDTSWIDTRAAMQLERFIKWRDKVNNPVVIEVGAGIRVPSIRLFSARQKCPIIRINTTDFHVSRSGGHIGVPLNALEGIKLIADILGISYL